MLLLLRKKRGEKESMYITYFRSGPLPVTWLCHFRSKDPTRADMVQLPVAHGQIILPVRVTSGRVTDVTSGHVTSGSTSQHLRKYDFVCIHILLISFNHNAFRKWNSTTDHLFSLQSFGKKTLLWFHWLPQGACYSVENSLVEDSEKQWYKRENIHCCI